jgi:hypothetical protein
MARTLGAEDTWDMALTGEYRGCMTLDLISLWFFILQIAPERIT